MSIKYANYSKLPMLDERKTAQSIYNSPINTTKDIYDIKRRRLIFFYLFFIVPGIFYKILINKSINTSISKHKEIIDHSLWKRLFSTDNDFSFPKIAYLNHELKSDSEKKYVKKINRNQKLEELITEPDFADHDLMNTIKEERLENSFFNFNSIHNKLDSSEIKDIYEHDVKKSFVVSTAKVIYSYKSSIINVSNFKAITTLGNIIGTSVSGQQVEFEPKTNLRGVVLNTKSLIGSFHSFTIISKEWDFQESVQEHKDVTNKVKSKEFEKRFRLLISNTIDYSEISFAFTKKFIDDICEYQDGSTPFIICSDFDGELHIFWREIDSSLTPFSEKDPVRFTLDNKYGISELTKDGFYISSIMKMLEVLSINEIL